MYKHGFTLPGTAPHGHALSTTLHSPPPRENRLKFLLKHQGAYARSYGGIKARWFLN